MPKKYKISLTCEELQYLHNIVNKSKRNARVIKRANILILADKNQKDKDIANNLFCHKSTVIQTRKKYCQYKNINQAIYDKPQKGRPRRLNEKQQAELTAIATSDAPCGRDKWTINLIMEQAIKKSIIDADISDETIRLFFKKQRLNLGRQNHGVSKK